ncbi:CENP-S associating centromere protein X-domain-containing protein [Aspergillus caelatus]|uniref:CENP-S associating centromere protein X-domain-containing protein n=1 Tax=Aspergillus caelatus TaxID=61420 RepID=A0A5N7A8X4_9EURO|nr:CENP-S associating centromere protein X-domain-containing protein [Aspergillus caelatus]KAE8366304.1 CENP-S associating centromere protein X-domain-containing protein [Aspergillus caelatus]
MPPERQPAQKRRQLPFKPPSRQSSATAGPSTSASASTSKPNPRRKPKSKSKVSAKSTTNAKASSSKTARPSTTSTRDEVEASESPAAASNSDSEASSGSSRSRSPSEEPDYILAEIIHADADENDVLSSEPAIPPKLLTKLVHHHFKGQKTKIAKDANEVVAKYVDVFVREALARAAFERAEGAKGVERGIGDGFLEVEDLEKMAPQLVLDF